MKRQLIALLTIVCAAPSAHASDGMAYEDNKLNLRNCSGEKVTARWFETKISISRAGAAPSDPVAAVEYATWDGACAKFSWNSDDAAFETALNGQKAKSSTIKYVAWDGGKWIAARTGAGFYVSRVATSDDADPSKDKFVNAAQWLRRHDPSNFGAATLVDALTEAASTE